MNAKLDADLARKTRGGKDDFLGSTGSMAAEALKSPKDVLALGRAIVGQLELPARGAFLERWMAHHLAEVLAEADVATGGAKTDAEAHAVGLILRLWEQRHTLHTTVDPLGGVRDAVGILRALAPEANPWRYSRGRDDADVLRRTFDTLAKVVVMGALLSVSMERDALTKAELKALSKEERQLLDGVARWLPIEREGREATALDLRFLSATETEVTASGAVAEECDRRPDSIRQTVIAALRDTHTELEGLISRWERKEAGDEEAN